MNRFGSIFSQLLQLFPRLEFQQFIAMTKAVMSTFLCKIFFSQLLKEWEIMAHLPNRI